MTIEEKEDELNSHGCCNKLSVCLSCLVLILLILIFSEAFFFLGFIGFSLEINEECTTSACVKTSAQISEFIDDTVDPCEDFYEFVCGKFEKVAYEKQMDNLLNVERERIKRHMETLIVDPPKLDDPRAVKMQKMYFQACLNDEIDENRDQVLIKKLLEVGDWPFLLKHNDWDGNSFDWIQVMIKARDLGLPFEWFLKVDLFNDENYELQLSHPENCGASPGEEYFEMQADIIEKLIRPGLDTYSEFANLQDFEIKLNRICANNSNSDVTLRRMSNLRFDNVTTVTFLKTLTKLMHKWKFDAPVAFNKNYMLELNQLIRRTPKKVQANYILWKIIESFAPYLSQPIRERHAEYLSTISGKEITRFQFCLDDTKLRFKHVSEIVQLQDLAESTTQENGEELVDSIKEQIVTFIEEADWRNNKTKESHLDFYGNLEIIIGGPDEVFEDDFIVNYVEAGKIEFFFENIIQMLTDWSQNILFSKMRMIGRPTIKALGGVYVSNSKFVFILDEAEEMLILPAAALNGLLYDEELPQYLNYAGLGITTAEELLEGLHLLKKSKSESYRSLEDNKKCFIESFHKSNQVNASFLFSKNYLPIMAQNLAYKAYQTYVEENGEESPLVNLNYSPNQLFWIQSSLNWCYQPLPEEAEEEALIEHQGRKYRITEAVKHSEFFTSDFNCSLEAPMNSKNKCVL